MDDLSEILTEIARDFPPDPVSVNMRIGLYIFPPGAIPDPVRITTVKPYPWEVRAHQLRLAGMTDFCGIEPTFGPAYKRRYIRGEWKPKIPLGDQPVN